MTKRRKRKQGKSRESRQVSGRPKSQATRFPYLRWAGAFVAPLIAVIGFAYYMHDRAEQRSLKVTQLLDDAWDSLGGHPGMPYVSVYLIAVSPDALRTVELARRKVREALEIDPDNLRAHNLMGLCSQMERKYSEAASWYRDAIELNPEDPRGHENLGQARFYMGLFESETDEERLGHFANAALLHSKAIELARGPDELATSKGSLSIALYAMGRFEPALREVNEAISIRPRTAFLYLGKADILQAMGQCSQADAERERARRIDPEVVAMKINLPQHLLPNPCID